MKKIAILQSNYIPWKGYFDLIAAVDEFILYDDAQFTKNDWRNRNKIKTPKGLEWITIPVGPAIHRRIRDVELLDTRWQAAHWKMLDSNYRRASGYADVAAWLMPIYCRKRHTNLSALNRELIEAICGYLGIGSRISNSWDYKLADGKSARLADLCVQAGASEYVTGPSARAYLDETEFTTRNIKVSWFDYHGYAEYPQLWGRFEHAVSIVDLLFNCGDRAAQFMRFAR